MKIHSQFIFIFLFISTFNLYSKTLSTKKNVSLKKQRAEFDSKKMIEVKYANPNWNKSSEKIDSGVILLKDSVSNRIMQVLLEETAPDSNIFSGTYSVNWGSSSHVKPEVYVLKNDNLLSQSQFRLEMENIQIGKIKRKPLVYRKNELGVQVLEVFDTADKVKEALALILKSKRNQNSDSTSITGKEIGLAQKLLSSEDFQKFVNQDALRVKENQKRILDRYRQEQIERDRIEKIKKELAAESLALKEKNKKLSQEFAEAALDFFRSGNFIKAEENFKKSFELNPEESKYYFQYGISLYKNQKYNESIVVFNIAKDQKDVQLESMYYMGLSQYALKEYELAQKTLEQVLQSKDEKLSPLSAFYIALLFYDQQFFEKSKDKFQVVLDTSNDPRLDEKAEQYIDQINQLILMAKMKEKKFFLSASAGALYDSNVLQQSDSSSDQGSASDQASLRYLTGLGFYYRPIFDSQNEFGTKIRSDYIYTQKDDLSDYDPLSFQITAPYTQRGESLSRAHTLSIRPGYELLYLGQDEESGRPEKTLKGYFLETSNSFVMNSRWITGVQFNFRKDSFFEDTDKNANKYTLKSTHVFMLDSSKSNSKTLLADVGFTLNQATGDSYTTQRLEVTTVFVTPIFDDKTTFIGGVGIYRLVYPDKSDEQKDLNYSLNANSVRALNEWLSLMFVSSYAVNTSNLDSSDYKRWSVGLTLSAELGF